MKTILLSLDLKNWRGFTGLIEFNPGRNVFSGPNGSGKTRIPDAVSWNLTGKDTRGKADSELKSIIDGSPAQKSEHGVLAVYDIDGETREFGRTFSEKWSKKRGSLEATKDGNQTVFSVDGIEVTKTKYAVAVASAFGKNYQLCSDLSAVTDMEWKKRRELLVNALGIESVEYVVEPGSDFEKLLNGRSVEDAKKQADQRKKTLKKKLTEANAAIEERKADVDNVGGIDTDMAQEELNESRQAVEKAKAAIEKAKGGDQSGNIEKLKNLNSDLFNAESDFQKNILKAAKKEAYHSNAKESLENELKNDRENLKYHQEERAGLLKVYQAIKATTPESVGNVCHECGQSLPAEKIQELTDNFNRNKSEKLETNISRGKDIKAEIERIEKQISEKESELKELEAFEPAGILKHESTPEIDKLKNEIYNISAAKKEVEIPAELIATLQACETRLTQAQETRAAVKSSADSVQRLEDLKKKKTELSAENNRIEKFLSLYQQYEQALADAIEKPVNNMFQTAYFKMFDTLEKADEDGNFRQVPACIVMNKEKRPYDTALSNGERGTLEIDVAVVMQKHFDINAPLFIDNAESITTPIDLDCQYIELRAVNLFKHNKTGAIVHEAEYNSFPDAKKTNYSLIETLTKEV